MNQIPNYVGTRVAFAVLFAGALAACGVDKQSAPSLSGPSEFAMSVTLTATPDSLVHDGSSQATIQALVRDATGQPVRGLQLLFSGTVTNLPESVVRFTATSVGTDGNGVATTQLIAPPSPATVIRMQPVITVSAVPVGSNYANEAPRTVQLRLVEPDGTPYGVPGLDAFIVVSRNTVLLGESVTFDASWSTFDGLACGSRCDYIWEFPGDDNPVVRGVRTARTFPAEGTFSVTLTVTDANGGVDTTSTNVRVIRP